MAPTSVVVARSRSPAGFLLDPVHQIPERSKLEGGAKLPPWAITVKRGGAGCRRAANRRVHHSPWSRETRACIHPLQPRRPHGQGMQRCRRQDTTAHTAVTPGQPPHRASTPGRRGRVHRSLGQPPQRTSAARRDHSARSGRHATTAPRKTRANPATARDLDPPSLPPPAHPRATPAAEATRRRPASPARQLPMSPA